MNDVEEIQKQIDALAEQLKQSQQQLFQLQQKLNASTILPSSNLKKQSSLPQEHSALENFIGLKIINLVGIVVLLIGISIGVKYAIDKNLITPFARILLAYSASAGLFILSLILKKSMKVSVRYYSAVQWLLLTLLLMEPSLIMICFRKHCALSLWW